MKYYYDCKNIPKGSHNAPHHQELNVFTVTGVAVGTPHEFSGVQCFEFNNFKWKNTFSV